MARSVLSGDNAAKFRIQRGKALFFGLIWLVFTLVLAGALIKAILLGELSVLGLIILVLLITSFAPAALDYLWSFLHHPIAIRIDRDGLSGHKFAPVPWSDIKDITALKGRKRHRYVGITLHDPVGYLAAQPLIPRLRSKLWQWRYGQDIVIEGFLLRALATEEIADAARVLRPAP